eukprot:TRINITY_DN10465_c0_g1_i1.p1 TRINITY_DN10465_c0_g1~~TRINITY_DN10465_c0_g1_i1.p1  ORF type:complete len:180 (-),score=43.74 TRINITY_DN10465_c0_g1_i1:128-613(-)
MKGSQYLQILLPILLVFLQPGNPLPSPGDKLREFGTIQRVSILTSACDKCGMTRLGRINLKICGGGPEPCCSVTNIGDFNGDGFNEGEIDNYSGNELEGCFNYALSTSDGPSDLSLTVYHEGSDGGQLDWVEVHTNSHSVRCPLGFWLDVFTSIKVACFAV